MKPRRERPVFLVPLVCVLATLLVAYVGGYYASARPSPEWGQILTYGPQSLEVEILPTYWPTHVLGLGTQYLFDPIHQLDRRLRPRTWTKWESPMGYYGPP